jgi:hypothetical protein
VDKGSQNKVGDAGRICGEIGIFGSGCARHRVDILGGGGSHPDRSEVVGSRISCRKIPNLVRIGEIYPVMVCVGGRNEAEERRVLGNCEITEISEKVIMFLPTRIRSKTSPCFLQRRTPRGGLQLCRCQRG